MLKQLSQQHANRSQSGDNVNGKEHCDKEHYTNTRKLGAEFLVNTGTETHIHQDQEVF